MENVRAEHLENQGREFDEQPCVHKTVQHRDFATAKCILIKGM